MGYQKYLRDLLNKRSKSLIILNRERQIIWRKEHSIVRIERPTNLVTARTKGYKAKQGIILARVRVKRGGKRRPSMNLKGRKPKKYSTKLVLGKNYQWIAEERTQRYFKNLEVLNSYKVGKDGIYYWFEVILVDPKSSVIKSSNLKWISSNKHTHRVFRGKTSAARKARALRGKGKGYEKSRPSAAAHGNRIK
ncbi:MAG TPA: 50S ribosomal protein L15e [Candidatus Nanoarchaeia archaeon]|nr:50S ribosomal protein L15e [Candidatus Nanoarchaeia archaeon]